MYKLGVIFLVNLIAGISFAIADTAGSDLNSNPVSNDSRSALTIVGAQRSGNPEGTIPPWTGGITTPPSNYKPGDWHPDPYKEDPLLFTVGIDNLSQHKDKLSAGHLALIEKYPASYQLKIYPSRRSASHPRSVLQRTQEDQGKARVVDNGAGITGILLGVPFPQPENGQQAFWNARLSYKTAGYRNYFTYVVTSNDGSYEMAVMEQEINYPYSDENNNSTNFKNIKIRRFLRTLRPAKSSGELILIHRFLNSLDFERRTWSYNPAKRRVKRATNVPPATPQSASDGVTLWDQVGMWRGPMTDFDWVLLGKREMYVPYNAYQLHSGELGTDDIIRPGHINQTLARYELHRVWVVEARLKAGHVHPYNKRRYYLDEDSWRIVFAEHYDNNDKVERFSESHNINYYEIPVVLSTLDVFYKLNTSRYYAQHIDNEYSPLDFSFYRHPSYYSPGRLKMKAKR